MIAAEGEHKASRSLRLAAEVIADSPAALQVRWTTFLYVFVIVFYLYLYFLFAALQVGSATLHYLIVLTF